MGDPTARTITGRVHSQQEQVPYPSQPQMPVSAAIVSGWGRKPSKSVSTEKENREDESGDRNGGGRPEGTSRYSGRMHDNALDTTVPSPSALEDMLRVESEDGTAVAERGMADLEVDNEDIEDVTARTENSVRARSSWPLPPLAGSGRRLLSHPSSSDISSTMPSHAVSAFESRRSRSETSENKRAGENTSAVLDCKRNQPLLRAFPYSQQTRRSPQRVRSNHDIREPGRCKFQQRRFSCR